VLQTYAINFLLPQDQESYMETSADEGHPNVEVRWYLGGIFETKIDADMYITST